MALEKTIMPPTATVWIPKSHAWPRDLKSPVSKQAIHTRQQLGLPIDRPIIASGHQPVLFHPGIVAKLIALDHWSKKTGSASVWVVPDQDVVDSGLVRLPRLDDGLLEVEQVRIAGDRFPVAPSMSVSPLAVGPRLPESFGDIGSWLAGYEHESSMARQFAKATIGLLCEKLELEEPTIVFASDLLGLEAGEMLLDAMLNDPKGAVESYNQSVDQHPQAGVGPLANLERHIELPIWRVQELRVPVMLDLERRSGFDRSHLVPRGLLMTAIMRLAACDLFIHGLGGYEYDQITEHWIQDWLNQSLCPMVAASATMTLDWPVPKTVSSAMLDPDRAVWMAHHARHNPAVYGDLMAEEKKMELVSQIENSKTNGSSALTAHLFAQLHQLLAESRSNHAQAIEELDKVSANAKRSRQTRDIINDRTWAFPLYSDAQMQSLKTQIIQALEGQG